MWITGHSLGGGYANAVVLHMLANRATAELFAAGAPSTLRINQLRPIDGLCSARDRSAPTTISGDLMICAVEPQSLDPA